MWLHSFVHITWTYPVNIRLDEDVLNTSWRRISSSSSEDIFKMYSSRRIYSPHSYVFRRRLQDVFETSWSRPIHSSWPYIFKTSSRRFQDVFKTSYKNVFKISSRRLQDVFKMSLSRLQASRRHAKMSSRRFQDVSSS